DEAPLDLDAGRFEADVLEVRLAPGRDEHRLGPDLLGLAALGADDDPDPVLRPLDGGGIEAGVRDDPDPALLEAPLDERRDLAVLEGHDPGQVLEKGDRDAEVVEERGELD